MGLSGRAIARFLVNQGAKVIGSEKKKESDEIFSAQERQAFVDLHQQGVELRFEDQPTELVDRVSAVVLSPGIPPTHPLVISAQSQGVEITNEAEIAFSLLDIPVIAITGTSGKSTVTTLIGKMLQSSGFNAYVGGNIGNPLIDAVECSENFDFIVAELSSYQLEQIHSLSPRVAVWTTIAPDHLERYGSMQNYIKAKRKLLELCSPSTTAVLYRDNPYTFDFGRDKLLDERRMSLIWFTEKEGLDETGASYDDHHSQFTVIHENEVYGFDLSNMKMLGRHNIRNLMAAACAVLDVGAKKEAVQKIIDTYPGLPHRLEFIRELRKVRYYNDSKATNTIAVEQSLNQFDDGTVVWLAGGKDKAIRYEGLAPLIEKKCAYVFYFGEARDRLAKEIPLKKVKFEKVEKLEDAIQEAASRAGEGATVLLSPACASFDAFKSFEARGDLFREVVLSLT